MAAVQYLGFFLVHLDDPQRVLNGHYHCAKFGCDRCSSFDNMKVSIFGELNWKTPISHLENTYRFLGTFDPLNGVQCQQTPKAQPCVSLCRLSRQQLKIHRAV